MKKKNKKHKQKKLLYLICAPFIVLVVLLFIAFTYFRVDPHDETLLTAQDAITIPSYFAPEWFRGQGIPVKIENLKEGYSTLPDGSTMYVLPHVLSDLPYKNLEETKQWVDYVNTTYHPTPTWTLDTRPRMGNYRCMAQSASTVVDWHTLLLGDTLGSYHNTFTGRYEQGYDYRIIDDIYAQRSKSDSKDYYYVPVNLHPDPVTHTAVPVSVYGYAQIISSSSSDSQNTTIHDYNLPLTFTYNPQDFHIHGPLLQLFRNKAYWEVALGHEPDDSKKIIEALHKHGIILAGIKARFSALNGSLRSTALGFIPLAFFSGHGVSVVGYIYKDGHYYFIYRETFGKSDAELADVGVSYRIFPIYGFDEMYTFVEPLTINSEKTSPKTYVVRISDAEHKPVDVLVGKELYSNLPVAIQQRSEGEYVITTNQPKTIITVAKDFFYKADGNPYTLTLQ